MGIAWFTKMLGIVGGITGEQVEDFTHNQTHVRFIQESSTSFTLPHGDTVVYPIYNVIQKQDLHDPVNGFIKYPVLKNNQNITSNAIFSSNSVTFPNAGDKLEIIVQFAAYMGFWGFNDAEVYTYVAPVAGTQKVFWSINRVGGAGYPDTYGIRIAMRYTSNGGTPESDSVAYSYNTGEKAITAIFFEIS